LVKRMSIWWIIKEMASVVFDGGFLLTFGFVAKSIFALIKELRYDVDFYKYEIYIPDWEETRRKVFNRKSK